MCGRTSLFVDQGDLESHFDAEVVADGGYRPRYNIAPGADLEVITNDAPDEIDRYHWGFVPPWADGPGDDLINARAETAVEKPTFSEAWASRPCLVPSSGFYEWQSTTGGPKRPFRIYREEEPLFAMAGLWDVWEGNGETLSTVTILTTEPNETVASIHDRMPVVLPREVEDDWLAGDLPERADLCRPYPGDDLVAEEISTRVNNPNNDDPRVLEPVDHEQSGLEEFGS